jgi:hypothetical protein
MEVADVTAAGDDRVDLFLGGHEHDVIRRYAGDMPAIQIQTLRTSNRAATIQTLLLTG